MINTALFDEKIKGCGLKKQYIYDSLGISRMSFNKKRTGKVDFRKSEIYVICDLLRLTKEEANEIFYPES
jgi:hypothetical protein